MKNNHIFSVICALVLSLSFYIDAFGQNSPQSQQGNVYYRNSYPQNNNQSLVSSNIGTDNKASGKNSFAGGNNSTASGGQSFAFGISCESSSDNAVAFGVHTKAKRPQAFAIGESCAVGNQTGGANGFAGGLSSVAYGNQSFSFGQKNSASGEQAFAIGLGSISSGNNAFAGGTGSHSEGINSFSFGNQTTASGEQSFCIGNGNASTGTNAFAGGSGSRAIGISSFTFGIDCSADEWASVSMGYAAISKGICSFAMGNNVQALQNDCFVIGAGHYQQPLISTTKGIMMGVGSSLPTMFISEAREGSTGRVAIGYSGEPPLAKLHIVANGTPNSGIHEDADILLQPLESEGNASILFRNENTYISVRNDNKLRLVASNAPMIFSSEKYCFGSESTFLTSDSEQTFTMNSPKRLSLVGKDVMASATNTANVMGRSVMVNASGQASFHGEEVYVSSNHNIVLSADTLITLYGKVGINTENRLQRDDYYLAVAGGVLTDKIHVLDVDEWADFVFEKDYRLMPLAKLSQYIFSNKHLPEVPTEMEVKEEGIDLVEMQSILLKKIEELTLYTLQQQEEIESLRKESARQQRMIDELLGK